MGFFLSVPQISPRSFAQEIGTLSEAEQCMAALTHWWEDFFSLRVQVVKPVSPDESTAWLQWVGFSGKKIVINSRKEADLKLSPKLRLQSAVFA